MLPGKEGRHGLLHPSRSSRSIDSFAGPQEMICHPQNPQEFLFTSSNYSRVLRRDALAKIPGNPSESLVTSEPLEGL